MLNNTAYEEIVSSYTDLKFTGSCKIYMFDLLKISIISFRGQTTLVLLLVFDSLKKPEQLTDKSVSFRCQSTCCMFLIH